ncbi:MAG: xanthine dehydrogenase family protein molybdopterin-binding subunit [Candidatus Puniceispirillaceae bacterium]
MKFGIGQSIERIEDDALITGKGQYSDDILPGQGLHVAFLRAPYGHATLISLDCEEAKQADGVVLVATQTDLDADHVGNVKCQYYVDWFDGRPMAPSEKKPMVSGKNAHAGDIVAMVVATTRRQAAKALDLIEADFEPLEAVTDVYKALEKQAPQVNAAYPGNIAFEWHCGKVEETRAELAKPLKDGEQIISVDVVNNRILTNSMETRPLVMVPQDDGLIVYSGSQGAVGLAEQISEAVNLPADNLQLITGDVGGGFGFKIFLHPEQICVAWAALKLGKIVRWQQERSEAFLSDLFGRDNRTKAHAKIDETGRVLAYLVDNHANMGSWLSNFGVYIPTASASRTLTTIYDIQTAGMIVKGVMTNTPAVDAYRGAGRPEANYVLERMMDHISAALSLPREEVRRRNMIKADQIPYKMLIGGTIDSGEMPQLMDEAMQKADWHGFASRKKEAERKGRFLGIGLAMYLEQSGNGAEKDIEFSFAQDGRLTIYASQQDNGQAHRTTLTQIASDILGYEANAIIVKQGDSHRNPRGTTGGARMTAVLGSTVAEASYQVIEKAKLLAADILEALPEDIEFQEGVLRADKTNHSISLHELAVKVAETEDSHPLSLKHSYKTKGATYPYGCHIVEIEVNPEDCKAKITRYVVVDDFGVVVNPLTLHGQIHGGIAQGVGQALYEYLPYDEFGQLLAGSLMDYSLPRSDHLPSFQISTRNTPCLNNTLGVKGSGEAGAIGAPPAVISALCDAIGTTHIDMPATPQAIFDILKVQGQI